jgi:hypothetical protein
VNVLNCPLWSAVDNEGPITEVERRPSQLQLVTTANAGPCSSQLHVFPGVVYSGPQRKGQGYSIL